MSIKEQMQADTADAMREGDSMKRDTLRLLLAAIKQTEIDQRVTLDDSGVQTVLNKQAKQRRESIADAEKADRMDLVAQEQAELAIIENYLPQMMTDEEIRAIVSNVIADLGATGEQDIGRIMSRLMPELKGKADGSSVNRIVREMLLE